MALHKTNEEYNCYVVDNNYCNLFDKSPLIQKDKNKVVVLLNDFHTSKNFPQHAPRRTFLPFCPRGFLFIRYLFMCMDLLNETKGYFNMTTDEKEVLQTKLFVELFIKTYDLPIEREIVTEHLTKLEIKAVKQEHYEVAELIKVVHKELQNVDYGNGL